MEKRGEIRTVLELKKELENVMEALLEDDDGDFNLEVTDNAIQALSALKEFKLKQTDKNLDFREPPPEFRCPISGILMEEPVVVASGQTYDELSIQKWLQDGNQRCPQTDQLLPHTVLIPNQSIKKLITNWCRTNRIDVPRTSLNGVEDDGENACREHLSELLERLSSLSVSDQRKAMKELRLLTTKFPSFRTLFGEMEGAIPQLFDRFLIERSYSDASLRHDLVATILNISTNESNRRKIVTGCPLAVSFLSQSLSAKSVETRSCAAAALSELSALDSNKAIIGKTGAIRPLIEVIEEGDPLALKDAASAVLNLCTVIENRERAISEGAVTAVMDKIIGGVLVDEMLDILAMLSSHHMAIEEMEEQGMLFCLFGLLREEETSKRSKEHCVAIVHAMCFSDRSKLRKINEVEDAYETLLRVARSGTSRARRKATGLLERLNRFAFISHTA